VYALAVVLTREEARSGTDSLKRHVVSRPIPVEFLCVSEILAAPQTRRERSENGGILSFRGESRQTYPITFWHASSKSNRRYTFYANSEGIRNKWYNALVNAITVRKAYQESNMVGF
jgi:RHO1 GDP-GTP exchange protein 1/2